LVSSRRDMAWWESGRHLLVTRVANQFVDRVVAVSESVRRHTIERERLPPGRIVTIPNGIDLAEFDDARRLDSAWCRPPGGGPVVAMTAGLRPVKAHEDLLAALTLLCPQYPGLRLLLIGDGPRRRELEGMVRRLGLEPHVLFLGWQDNVASLLDQVDVFVLSSTSEGQSNAILEAMAASRPAVATKVGGNPDTVEDGVTGLLVPPRSPERLAESIGSLLADPARARALGAAGRARVERLFSAHAMARRLEDLYAAVAGGERGEPR
jgi:glycosyltransferase involved in cell wall biosynthesis